MYLLDTNVVSELRAGKARQSEAVRAWAATVDAQRLYLSAVTVMELDIGVRRIERRDDHQGRLLRGWLDQLLARFARQVLPFDAPAALACAAMHVPDPRPFRDAMIAATARQHGLVLVTRNLSDFAALGVPLLDPWQWAGGSAGPAPAAAPPPAPAPAAGRHAAGRRVKPRG